MSDQLVGAVASEIREPEKLGANERKDSHPGLSLTLATIERFGLALLLVGLIVVFSCIEPSTFATSKNWRVIGASQAVTLVIALGLQFALITGSFDLSIGSVAAASAMLAANLMASNHQSLLVACLAALCLGLVVGLINGLIVTVFKVDGLIATLGSGTILGGLVSWYSQQRTIATGLSSSLISFGFNDFVGVPKIVWVALGLALIVAYVQTMTPFGRRLTAIGSNREAARLVGIRVELVTCWTYMIASLIGAGAGILMLAQQESADPSTPGLTVMFPALAAVFLGTASFFPGVFNVLGTVVGLLIVAVLVSGLTLLGAASWVQPVAYGGALVLAVALSTTLRRRRAAAAIR